MDPKTVLRDLRNVQEHHKNDFTPTFQISVSDMARDAANTIESLINKVESLQVFVDEVMASPNCNDCGYKNCLYSPGLGRLVRFNCPLHVKREEKKGDLI